MTDAATTNRTKAINLEAAKNEAALTNYVASDSGDSKDSIDQPEVFPPISPPSGTIPVPPNQDAMKEHQLSGYRATALQGMNPGEPVAAYEARAKATADEYAAQQKKAAAETAKMTGQAQQQAAQRRAAAVEEDKREMAGTAAAARK